MRAWMTGLLGVALLTSVATALPPFFVARSPESVIVDLNAGQNSFECTGTAIDFDPGDIIHLYTAPLPSFMTFDAQDGNPATFRLYGENLSDSHLGGYIVSVGSEDRFGTQNGEGVSFVIGIVPEPGSLVALALAPMTCRKRF